MGQAEINLNFLEYYGGKETEKIELNLNEGGLSVILKMIYRQA